MQCDTVRIIRIIASHYMVAFHSTISRYRTFQDQSRNMKFLDINELARYRTTGIVQCVGSQDDAAAIAWWHH